MLVTLDTLFSPVVSLRMTEELLIIVFKSNLQSVVIHTDLTDAQSYSLSAYYNL